MHVYIYDDYLSSGRYNKAVNRLEIRLTDLGLNGKIIRLGGIKNIRGTIQSEIKLGAKTIIAVGNNQTVNRVIGAITSAETYDSQKKTLLGIIPLGDDNTIAASFGIRSIEEACNVLLARRIEKIDLGLVGKHYFLNQATITTVGTALEINGCTLETEERGEIRFINLYSGPAGKGHSNPHDGLLDISISTRRGHPTQLQAAKARVENSSQPLLIDGVVEVPTPVEVGVIRDQVSVIVGRDRLFE